MLVAAVLVVAAVFGGADQYLGSLSWLPWGAAVSLLSAPWLLLPFAVGATRRTPRGGAWLGLGATWAALAGYGLLTLSPLEGADPTPRSVAGFVVSESPVLVGALVTGPLFGWLGARLRARRALWGAAVVAASFALEPVVRIAVSRPLGQHDVALAEALVGVAGLAVVAACRARKPARGG